MKDEIITTQDVADVLASIDVALAFLFKQEAKPKDLHPLVVDCLKYKSRNTVISKLEALQKELLARETAEIGLSFVPSRESLGKIHKWFYDNAVKSVILDVYVDPNIVGGTIIAFGGRRFDESLGTKIDAYFKDLDK